MYVHINLRVKVMNIVPVEETVSSSNTELIYRKAMGIDETGNMPITFYGELTSVPNANNIYEITHILISSFNYESILKTTQRTAIKLFDNDEVAITLSEDLLTSLRATVNGTKIVELHQESLEKRCLCSSNKSQVVPDDDNVIECACGYMTLKDAAAPNSVINVSILDEHKHKNNVHVKFDQIEDCYN